MMLLRWPSRWLCRWDRASAPSPLLLTPILGIQGEIQKICQTYGLRPSSTNPYIALTPQDINTKWDTVSAAGGLSPPPSCSDVF